MNSPAITTSLTLGYVTFDAADAGRLAAFWAGVLRRPVDDGASEQFATVGADGDDPLLPALMFIQVPEPKIGKNRIHIDLLAGDWRAEVDRVVELGGTNVGEFDESGAVWATLADTEGNVFDIGAHPE
jgi:predicted enzyme related to lactoylglutathione lyase